MVAQPTDVIHYQTVAFVHTRSERCKGWRMVDECEYKRFVCFFFFHFVVSYFLGDVDLYMDS